jgi:hypothetical protein
MLVYKCMMRMVGSRDRLCCLVTHVYVAYFLPHLLLPYHISSKSSLVLHLDQIPEILHHLRTLLHTDPLRPRRLLRHISMHNPRIRSIIQPLIRADQNHAEEKAAQDRHAEHSRDDAVAVPVAVGRHVPHV